MILSLLMQALARKRAIDAFATGRHPGENRGPETSYDPKSLDSGFRRNDEKTHFLAFYQTINQCSLSNDQCPVFITARSPSKQKKTADGQPSLEIKCLRVL